MSVCDVEWVVWTQRAAGEDAEEQRQSNEINEIRRDQVMKTPTDHIKES